MIRTFAYIAIVLGIIGFTYVICRLILQVKDLQEEVKMNRALIAGLGARIEKMEGGGKDA